MSINVENAAIRFQQQCAGAKRRGIEWAISFEEWLAVWEASGKWESRGIGRARYVMARFGDVGPYAASNVEIITSAQNTVDAHKNGRFQYRVPQRPGDINFDSPPELVPVELVEACATYREAVRACWAVRRVQRLTLRSLSMLIDGYASHVTDWLADDDRPGRRSLPPHLIHDFEWITGNCIVTQWLSLRSSMFALDEEQAARASA